MKLVAVFFCIVETAKLCKLVVAKISKTRVLCDLVSPCDKFCIKMVKRILIFHSPVKHLPVYFFSQLAVRAFKELGSLLDRILLTVNLNGHLTGDDTKLLLHHVHFGLDRNIRFAEKFYTRLNASQVSKKLLLIQFFCKWTV